MSLAIARFDEANQANDAAAVRAATERIERALLGAVMTVGILPRATPGVEDFATEAHRVTWEAILVVAARGDAPYLKPVVYELARAGTLERAGGAAAVSMCLDSTDCEEIAPYARLVQEAARLRSLARLARPVK